METFDREPFEAELRRLDALELWDFELSRLENGSLLILGSNNFTYYHDVEAEFDRVTYTDLPDRFSHARFRLGKDSDAQATVWVTAAAWTDVGLKEYEVRASGLAVRVGTVYYYDRPNLQPGERIAGR